MIGILTVLFSSLLTSETAVIHQVKIMFPAFQNLQNFKRSIFCNEKDTRNETKRVRLVPEILQLFLSDSS